MVNSDNAKVAVITGAGSGIGAATAQALDSAGWNIVLCGRRPTALDAASADLTRPSLCVPGDISDAETVDQLFQETVEQFGRVDLLFNNAGIGAPAVPIEDLAIEQWREVVDVNLTGSWLCCRAAFQQMKTQKPGGGRIINNGSISAQTPRPYSAPYTATKHAMTGLTKALSLEGRDYGIAVGQIDIGNARTPLTAQMQKGVLQPNGDISPEATMDATDVARANVMMAGLPLDANIPQMTIMANGMPFIGRG